MIITINNWSFSKIFFAFLFFHEDLQLCQISSKYKTYGKILEKKLLIWYGMTLLRKQLLRLQKEKLQIAKEKMKQRSFFASALHIVLLSCILHNLIVKKFLIISQL